jgi:penicillin-binding protein 1A
MGMTPCDQVPNIPPIIVVGGGGKTWSPQDPHADGSMVSLRWGLAQSSNSVAAYLMKQYGPEQMVRMMHRMGITSYVDPVASLCVGSADLSVYEMVSAYNTFPSGGIFAQPLFVNRIEDSEGNVLTQMSERKREAISEHTAWQMVDLMRSVVDAGTGNRLRYRYGLRGQIAGKTGTTNDNSDGWFIGYTPTITAGVWVGGEDRYVHFNSTALGQGANMALPIWGLWMKKCIADGTVGVSDNDVFVIPETAAIGCTGNEQTVSETETMEDYYFE